jgi:large subunit ribosomal protein L30e
MASSGLPREEVSLQTLEGTCSHAYSSPLQIELGTACGKLFRCSTMAILDAGDSDILNDQQA